MSKAEEQEQITDDAFASLLRTTVVSVCVTVCFGLGSCAYVDTKRIVAQQATEHDEARPRKVWEKEPGAE